MGEFVDAPRVGSKSHTLKQGGLSASASIVMCLVMSVLSMENKLLRRLRHDYKRSMVRRVLSSVISEE